MVNRKKESLDDEKPEPRVRNRAQTGKANKRVRAEDALKESETRFRSVVESATNAVVLADSSGTIISWNKSAEKIFLYTEEEVLGKPFTILMPERYRDAHVAELNRVTLAGEFNLIGKTVEMYGLKKDGTEFPLELSLATWKTQQGTFYSGIIHDITERKKAEKALQESELHYRLLFENMLEGFAFCRMLFENDQPQDFIYLDVNTAFKKLTGLYDVVGKKVTEVIPGIRESHPELFEIYGRVAMTGKPERFEIYLDVIGWLDISVYGLEKGSFVAVFDNITKRKKAEEERERLSRHNKKIFDSIGEGIYGVDMEGKTTFINPAAASMLGYEAEGLIGKPAHEAVHHTKQDGTPYPKEECPTCAVLKTGVAYSLVDEVFWRRDGTSFPVEYTCTPVIERGEITGAVVVFRDVTERKKAEEMRIENLRLEAADKAKSEFLANMSHELRTPLNASIGFSELLKQDIVGKLNEKQKHFVDNILTSSQFLLNLINDILDLSKVEAGKIELAPEKISVPATIKETLSLIKEKAMKHNVLLKTEFDPELEFMEADKQRFKQILFNLLSNAVKFSKEEGGKVTITTNKEGEMAKVSVSDTGIGIREENVGKLFQKFEQLESGISQKYGGTGLGLAISKQLVELHGGNILAESKYGEGSTFTFMLPLSAKSMK
ncbi:MAG: PAS domain S-box protein [Candidatus Methanoperedens sp.]